MTTRRFRRILAPTYYNVGHGSDCAHKHATYAEAEACASAWVTEVEDDLRQEALDHDTPWEEYRLDTIRSLIQGIYEG